MLPLKRSNPSLQNYNRRQFWLSGGVLLTAFTVLCLIKPGCSQPVISLDPCVDGPFLCNDITKNYQVPNPDNCTTYFNCSLRQLYLKSCLTGELYDRARARCRNANPSVSCQETCSGRADYKSYIHTRAPSVFTSPLITVDARTSITVSTKSQRDAVNISTTVAAAASRASDVLVTSSLAAETLTSTLKNDSETRITPNLALITSATNAATGSSLSSDSVQRSTTTDGDVKQWSTTYRPTFALFANSTVVQNRTVTQTSIDEMSSVLITKNREIQNATINRTAGSNPSSRQSTTAETVWSSHAGNANETVSAINSSFLQTSSVNFVNFSSSTTVPDNLHSSSYVNVTSSPLSTNGRNGNGQTQLTSHFFIPLNLTLNNRITGTPQYNITDHVVTTQSISADYTLDSSVHFLLSSTAGRQSVNTTQLPFNNVSSTTGNNSVDTTKKSAPNQVSTGNGLRTITDWLVFVNSTDTWMDNGMTSSVTNNVEQLTVTSEARAETDHNILSLSGSDMALEGQPFSLQCSFRRRYHSGPTRVTQFRWLLNGQILDSRGKSGFRISSDLTADQSDWWNSTLSFYRLIPAFSGQIICDVEYLEYSQFFWHQENYNLKVTSLPVIQITPLSSSVFVNQKIGLYCQLVGYKVQRVETLPDNEDIAGSLGLQTTNFTWFQNNLPLSISNLINISSYEGKSSLSAVITHDGNFSCMATNAAGNSTLATSLVFVLSSGDDSCSTDEADGISWPRTKVNTVVYSSCPADKTGTVSRWCVFKDNNASWENANFDNCLNYQLYNLLQQLDALLQGFFVKPSIADDLASELVSITSGQDLSLSDLIAAIEAIGKFATFRNSSTGLPPPSRHEIESVVKSISNVLNPGNRQKLQNDPQRSDGNIAVNIMHFVDIYGNQLAQQINSTTELVSDNLLLVADTASVDSPVIVSPNSSDIEWAFPSDRIAISSETTAAIGRYIGKNSLSYYSVYYRNLDDWLPKNSAGNRSNEFVGINSRVFSLSIIGLSSSSFLNPPMTFELQHETSVPSNNLTANCAFWNFSLPSNGSWSTANCSVFRSNASHTVCQCTHLTNFAILMSLSPADNLALSIISIVGCSLSIAGLFLTIVIYAVMWKYFKSHHAVVLINFCISLIIANSIFLAAIDKTQSKVLCLVIAVLLHYFYLAAFFLMLAEGVEMLLYIIFVFHVRRRAETAALIFTAWFLPAVIVGISLAVTRTNGYGSDTSCWLDIQSGLIWAFVGPALLIILVNFIILIIVLYRISRSNFVTNKIDYQNRVQATMWNILVLCPILGVTWVFGVLSVNQDLIAFQYIFAVANSLQGVFVFIFQAVCHNRKNKGSYSTRRFLCFDWPHTRSTTSKTSKSAGHSSSQSNSDAVRHIHGSHDDNGTCSHISSNFLNLSEHEFIGYQNSGYESFRPVSGSWSSRASTGLASNSTVSTHVSGGSGYQPLTSSHIDFTPM